MNSTGKLSGAFEIFHSLFQITQSCVTSSNLKECIGNKGKERFGVYHAGRLPNAQLSLEVFQGSVVFSLATEDDSYIVVGNGLISFWMMMTAVDFEFCF